MSKDDATITVDMDRTCMKCHKPGAMPNGLCMTCAFPTRWDEENTMGETTDAITWTETRYLSVPLTPDELRERGELLAEQVRAFAEMEAEHGDQRKAMKDDEAKLDGQVQHLAGVVRARAESRSVRVEVRYNPTLALIKEVRTDTGEVVETRQPTADDKARAQMAAQPGLL